MSTPPTLPDFYRLLAYDEVGSTNEEARRFAAEGAPEGTLVWARSQSAGRARRGRQWVSDPGNLYFSLILRPNHPAAMAAQLGFAAALAIGEAAVEFLPDNVRVGYKWPNDVLVEGRKLSGILLESQGGAPGRIAWLVLGCGINLASFPEGTETPATSLLAAGGGEVAPGAMLEAIAGHFLAHYERWCRDGFAPLRQKWLARVHGLHQTIRVRLSNEEILGVFAGLDEDGTLLLDQGAARRHIGAGEVFLIGR